MAEISIQLDIFFNSKVDQKQSYNIDASIDIGLDFFIPCGGHARRPKMQSDSGMPQGINIGMD